MKEDPDPRHDDKVGWVVLAVWCMFICSGDQMEGTLGIRIWLSVQ